MKRLFTLFFLSFAFSGLVQAQEKMSLAVEQSTNSMTQGVTALRAAVDDVKEYKS